jgi:signal transduction histidine kinase
MEQSPLAIEILTPDGRISQVNAAWRQLWNVNEEQADMQVEDLGVLPQVKRAFAGERVVLPPIKYSASQAAEDLGLDFEANVPWIQCHLYPVRDENGSVAYVVNTYMDITEIKRADEEAHKHRDALARMDRTTSMGQLTGSIAHELNQPLTGILSNAQAGEMMIKLGRPGQEELAEALGAIAEDAKRAGDVIRGLQELYREHRIESNPVDLNALIEETTELLHSEFIIKEVELTTACAPSIPVIKGNRIQLQQVLVNLVTNGIQAMTHLSPSDRQLHIKMTCDTNEVRVSVEDCGRGIDADKVDAIFEPLATWKPGGTGMGLAICNSIIEAHDGRMWAGNLPTGGAGVGFILPVPRGDQQV